MGLSDFAKGLVDASIGPLGNKVLDVVSGPVGDKVIDIASEPMERKGQLESLIGGGVNKLADASGWVGDKVESGAIALGVPKPIAKPINFIGGGAGQWVGRSVGGSLQTIGTFDQNIDTASKAGLDAANFTADHPAAAVGATVAAAKFGANYVKENPDKVAGFAKDTAVETVTDPVNLALLIGTGGTGTAAKAGLSALAKSGTRATARAAAKSAAEAGAKGVAEGVVEAGAKSAAEAGAKGVVEAGAREATEAGAKAAAEAAAAAGAESATGRTFGQVVKDVYKSTYTGINKPSAGSGDLFLESLSRHPSGRLAQARAGWADSFAGSEPGLVRSRIANKITPGTGKPKFGGRAAEMAWRVDKVGKNVARANMLSNATAAGAEIAVDPAGYAAGYAREKVLEEADERGIGKEAGYYDPGQTTVSPYQAVGAAPPGLPPGPPGQLAPGGPPPDPWKQTAQTALPPGLPPGSGGTGGGAPPNNPPPGGRDPLAQPPGGERPFSYGTPQYREIVKKTRTAQRQGGQHFWEGPRSQWAGGISPDHDWRTVDPLRKVNLPKYGTQYTRDWEQIPDSPLRDMTGPDGRYSYTSQQQPEGSAFPKMVDTGIKARSYNLTNVEEMPSATGELGDNNFDWPTPQSITSTSSEPETFPGTLGTGQSGIGPARSFIDVASHHGDDYGSDNSGQGFFNFGNFGPSMGAQPNTGPMARPMDTSSGPQGALVQPQRALTQPKASPMYNTGSRNQRRRAGLSTTGMNPNARLDFKDINGI